MGKLRGFMEYDRVNEQNIDVQDRVKNYKEFTVTPSEETLPLDAPTIKSNSVDASVGAAGTKAKNLG